ncbi:MAG: TolC family protein [Thermoanaerobaculales bacterium]|nr:TolC family protein [Thermoanaerobaculales bacterium]
MRRFALPMLTITLAVTGCTLGPDAERPLTAADTAATFVNAQDAETPDSELAPWWTRFGDQTTTDLVELALENNTDLQVAAARLLEAEAAWGQSRSTLWPKVDYSISGSRTKSSFVLPEMGRRTIYSTTYSDGINVSYQIDLFGKLKRSRQAAWANLLAEQAARETIEHSVIAGVVRARVQVATAERAHEIAREIQTSWEQTLATVERRYRSGLVGAVDLHLARENLAATRAAETQLDAAVKMARHGLDVLVGRTPGTGPLLPDTLPELPDLSPVPAGLPAALLDRRPDLLRSEMQLSAAIYGIGAALADLYPSLSLTGSAGSSSDSLGDLLDIDSVVYNTVANLIGPIFSGGARKTEVEAARARANAAGATYAGVVLNALREVEDALVADEANRRRLEHTRYRLTEATSADTLSRERYSRGVEAFLKVLETERRLRSAEEALITTRADTWNTRIDLFLALGGDWTLPNTAPESAGIPTEGMSSGKSTTDPKSTKTKVSP